MTDQHDRRRFARIEIRRRCKIYDPRGHRYLAGTTCNLSPGGMLVRLDQSLPSEDGDRIYIAIAGPGRRGLIQRDDFVPATIIRTVVMNGERYLAVSVEGADAAPVTRLDYRLAA